MKVYILPPCRFHVWLQHVTVKPNAKFEFHMTTILFYKLHTPPTKDSAKVAKFPKTYYYTKFLNHMFSDVSITSTSQVLMAATLVLMVAE
jgi:hypothetical protein